MRNGKRKRYPSERQLNPWRAGIHMLAFAVDSRRGNCILVIRIEPERLISMIRSISAFPYLPSSTAQNRLSNSQHSLGPRTMKKILVTGSSGLIGSEVCMHFASIGWQVHGLDNNQRAVFFGDKGDNRWNQHRLESSIRTFRHHELDIRQRDKLIQLIAELEPDAIVHTAAQPSHDRAAAIPFQDFDTNAVGTFNLLEATRQYSTDIPFVHLSTNKVYGDAPNEIPMVETETRYEYDDPEFVDGIPETFRIDQTKHSLFGASKVAADVCVQEYGRYFGMPTTCLRGGCLTGPNHGGVELHGFLSYLIRCNLEEQEYTIFGYQGKQVRDNIHSYDVARFIEEFINAPRVAEVYNLGGGKSNTCSILEAFAKIENISGTEMRHQYLPENRIGDHQCYYSDLRKMKRHFPNWTVTKSLDSIIEEIHDSWRQRLGQSIKLAFPKTLAAESTDRPSRVKAA